MKPIFQFHLQPVYDNNIIIVCFFDSYQYQTLSGVIVARGDTTDSFQKALKLGLATKIRSSLKCVDWNPFPIDAWTGLYLLFYFHLFIFCLFVCFYQAYHHLILLGL